jgi:hypothetical protein
MNIKGLLAFSILAASTICVRSGFAQEMTCIAHFQTSTQMRDVAPGSLATPRDTPCRLTAYINGIANGRRAPGRARQMKILQQPQNGRAEIVDRTSFIFTPKPGFTGSDTMLVRMTGRIRFAITVY